MKTRLILFISFIGQFSLAQNNKPRVSGDTIRGIQNMESVVVKGLRAQDAPNNTTVNKTALNSKNFGQDMPTLLEFTPSVVTTSDAGAGIGYSGLRIRGVDASRINVTINGVPVNDPESHDVYWVNMPDLVGSIENMQVQRGVGSSTNGAAAFGASVNIKTNDLRPQPAARIDFSGGSFGTLRGTLQASTGLLNNRFSLDARLSEIRSGGYLDRASADLRSLALTATYLTPKSIWKAVVLNGAERTYQAWYGTPESRYRSDEQGMLDYAARNGLSAAETQNLLQSGRTYNYYTYANQVDNYNQDNYQLHFIHRFSSKLDLNLAAHYTYGRGYYEEYRTQDELSDYGLAPVVVGTDSIMSSDLIRRRWLDNHFVGIVYGLNYQLKPNWKLTLGGAANRYTGLHFGQIIWAQFASNSQIYDRYYENDANKSELSTYLKSNYSKNGWDLQLDLQYRGIAYSFLGVDQVSGVLADVTQNVQYHFFNPKLAFAKLLGSNKLFGSVGIANREPVRRDFRESTPQNRPLPERMYDAELAYRMAFKRWTTQANLFLMYYQDQLVLTGQINDVGGYTRTNVDQSYRAGLELEFAYQLSQNWRLQGATTLSQNKVMNFVEYVDVYLDEAPYYTQAQITHGTTDLAFSPNFIHTLGLQYQPTAALSLALQSKYVSRQYLDNTSNVARSLDPFTFTNFICNYKVKQNFAKEMEIGLLVNNLFNALYANNGYTFSYQYGGLTTTENFYYPQAGRHFLLKMNIQF
ncbi:MAG: TonB-dependent receptor [Flavobacteriia bacterium]|jgi:iron complex outermembrane receptor protein|nr:MAG: TonB-dependent receptor [Flavobacteriia bacterium]